MPRKRTRERVYWRTRGGDVRRAYADFRDFADVGGKREPLRLAGSKVATEDADVARELAAKRLKELEQRRRGKGILGSASGRMLKEYVRHHLLRKAEAGEVTERWMQQNERFLARAIEYFGANRPLDAISVADVTDWIAVERRRPGRKKDGVGLSPSSVRHHLSALSNLYRRAKSEEVVDFNPAQAMMDKPSAGVQEARFLEVPDATLVLEAARLHRPTRGDAIACAYPLVATFLLTGGRKAEVLGLEVSDVSLKGKTVTFRPNSWRGLKTKTSYRTMRLWPQLEEILREYLAGEDRPTGALLFPSMRGDKESMIHDIRKLLDGLAGLLVGDDEEPSVIRSRIFRHTYCAARLQTLDGGAPVSTFTVGRELGHGGMSLVNRVYGHLGEFRHRGEFVEYHVAQHQGLAERVAEMKERLNAS